jgi:glucosamine--fructose-6-phosphate aminotransferase (isomerizing)
MVDHGKHTLIEIQSQPIVWKAALEVFRDQTDAIKSFWSNNDFDYLLFTGCGSTYYLAQIAAALFQPMLGIHARAYPASELVLIPDRVFPPNSKPLLITVSRSGRTSETVEAARLFRKRTGQAVATITCYGDSELAQEADLALVIPDSQEESLAQTRSFSSMLLVLQAMLGLLAEQEANLQHMSTVAQHLLDDYGKLAKELGENQEIERFFFLGIGSQYGLACEVMLKMKEMSLSYSEAYNTLEFRHGPMSMVNDKTLVVCLISEETRANEVAVLHQMREQGAKILSIAESDAGFQFADWSYFVHLKSGLPHWVRPALYLPVLQLMAYYRAMARGVNPDQPANLKAFISIDNLAHH